MRIQHVFDDVSDQVIAAALDVHRILGAHFQELTYQRALVQEFMQRELAFGRKEKIPVYYRGRKLHTRRVDFIVEGILVEIKAKMGLEPRDFEQTLSYLKASEFKTALLLNFGSRRLEIKRIVN